MPHGSSDRYYSQKYKKFLDTILEQLPQYINQYPVSEQPFLKAFMEVLQGYAVDTQEARDALTMKFKKFTKKYAYSEIYYKLSFLWFAVDYFNTATRLLSVATFYGKNFYSYLVQHLRENSEVQGAFSLIKNIVPLTDLKWEQLQYSCIKLQDPLSNEELQVLDLVYAGLRENNPTLDFLDAEKIKLYISNEIKNSKFIRQLPRFFTRIDAKWLLWICRSAFGVEQLVFSFTLKDSTSFFDVISLHDPSNALLCASEIYQVLKSPKTFHGVLNIPTQYATDLLRYLEECANQGKIRLQFLEKVTETKLTHSFKLYKANEGWYSLSSTKKDILARGLTTSTPRKRNSQRAFYYYSSDFNRSWHYTEHPDSIEAIKFYCKEDRTFSYNDLLGSKNGLINKKYSKSEIELLDEFIQSNIVQIAFYSYHLLREYSLDYYLVIIPPIAFFQLSRLLEWLPRSHILFAKKNIYLRAYLTLDLVNWIKNSLKWSIMPINLYFARFKRDFNQMFDLKGCKWKVPHLLHEWSI